MSSAESEAVQGAPRWARRLPWIDGFAALAAGVLLFVLRGPLADLYGLSHELLTVIALANTCYATLGLTLGMLRPRPAWLLVVLVVANLIWAAACVLFAAGAPATATGFGYAHLLGEGAFVATLALLEWRHRSAILAPS